MVAVRLAAAVSRAVMAGLVTAAVIVAGPAPASAALPSGEGWSAWWRYTDASTIKLGATIPGAELAGTAVDASGTRTVTLTVMDQAADGMCVRMRYTSDGTVIDKDACGLYMSNHIWAPVTNEAMHVELCRLSGDNPINCNAVDIPPSINDPTLRSTGTGAEWTYHRFNPGDPHSLPDYFSFTLHRPGVTGQGDGIHVIGARQFYMPYAVPDPGVPCTSVRLVSATTSSTVVGCGLASHPTVHLAGWVLVEACAITTTPTYTTTCIGIRVVMPS